MNLQEAVRASVLAYLRREVDEAATGIFDIDDDMGRDDSGCDCRNGMSYYRVRVWFHTRSHPSLQYFEFRCDLWDFLKGITLDV